MFGINFGPKKEAPKNTSEQKSSKGWRTFLTYFLAGALSLQALESSAASMTPEEKKQAIELMSSSPEKVLSYETLLLAEAESVPMISDGFIEVKGIRIEKGHKEISGAEGVKARISYEGGVPKSIDVRTPDDKDGTHVIFSDGSHDEPLDGRIDAVTTYGKNQHFVSSYGFVESYNAQGSKMIELASYDWSGKQEKVVAAKPESAVRMYADSQRALEENMRLVADKGSSAHL